MRRSCSVLNRMKLSGCISEHDMKIAKKLAFVIAGGKVPFGTEVDEEYLLDLEREAFLSLVANRNHSRECSICL